MSGRRSKRRRTQELRFDQLRNDPERAVSAAKKEGGCIVVDNEGKRLFSLWIPQTPIADAD